jgi:hypothetical protein
MVVILEVIHRLACGARIITNSDKLEALATRPRPPAPSKARGTGFTA